MDERQLHSRREALQRLDARYRHPADPKPFDEGSAWAAVLRASVFGILRGDEELLPAQDYVDALHMLPEVEARLERAQLSIIGAAREAGVTWDQIGLALGFEPDAARQGASSRHQRLKRRLGKVVPLAAAPGAGADV